MAKKGTEVEVDKHFYRLLVPEYPSQTSLELRFFYTPNYDATYCDEPEMKSLGNFAIDLPDVHLGLNRPVLVSLCFGAMEIVITATNVKNGKVYRCTFSYKE